MKEEISIRLSERQDALWRRFATHTTEMVVTKTGRKMFPKLEYIIRGLDQDTLYALVLHIEPVDDNRYKFSNGEWVSSGKADAQSESKKIWHADGVMSGKQWMSNPICFDRVKITNNPSDSCASHIYLHSMHKYIPVLSIYESPSNCPFLIPQQASKMLATSQIPYTEFIAVTAYQNQSVTSLKIAHNPFAKGFREGGSSDRKRTSPSSDDQNEESNSSQLSSPQPKKSRCSPPHATMPQNVAATMFGQAFNPFILSAYSPIMIQQFAAAAATGFQPFPMVFSPINTLLASQQQTVLKSPMVVEERREEKKSDATTRIWKNYECQSSD